MGKNLLHYLVERLRDGETPLVLRSECVERDSLFSFEWVGG